jgi:hypothetical protein
MLKIKKLFNTVAPFSGSFNLKKSNIPSFVFSGGAMGHKSYIIM